MTELASPTRASLRGIIPPLVTPLRDRDTLDLDGLDRLISHTLSGGVHGLFVLGTTGEGPSLGYRLRREVIDHTCRLTAGRVPVLVGVTDTAFVESVALARHAADAGAAAVVLSAPYYFPLAQPELTGYLGRIIPRLPLPVVLYNMPAMTKVRFEPETLRRVIHMDRIVGIKDSSGDPDAFDGFLAVARQRPDWSVLMGPEHLLAEALRRGGHGGVAGGANVWPRLFVDLYAATAAADAARMVALHENVLALGRIYEVGHGASSVVRGLKCALALLGLCDDRPADPFDRLAPAEREQVRGVLSELGLLP